MTAVATRASPLVATRRRCGAAARRLVTAVADAGVAAAYVLAGRALQPLHRVTATARRLSGRRSTSGSHYAGADDEVAELADTFDAMLDRLAPAFDSQKRFVANASHELRTPLAVMRTEVDVTLDDPEADLAELRADGRGGPGARRSGPTGWWMRCWCWPAARRSPGAGWPARSLVDLADAVAGGVDRGRSGGPPARACEITTDLRPAPVVGDPSLLERLAGNLVENAVRYNHLHGGCGCTTGSDPRTAWLMVRQHRIRGASRRMCRGCSSRSGGAAGNAPARAARGSGCRSSGRCVTRTAARCTRWPGPRRRVGGDGSAAHRRSGHSPPRPPPVQRATGRNRAVGERDRARARSRWAGVPPPSTAPRPTGSVSYPRPSAGTADR